MKDFYNKIKIYLFIACLPFLLILTRYIFLDPFCDFNIDKDFSLKFWFNSLGDFSAKKIEYKNDLKRNTFIFGSSRSTNFYCCYIKKQIFNNDKKVHPYYFGNYGETIGGIYEKLLFLSNKGYKIKNTIILLDPDMAFEANGEPQKYDYRSFVNRSRFQDYTYHFNAFFSNQHHDLKYKVQLLMGINIIDSLLYTRKSDPVTNDQGHICNIFKPFNDSIFVQKKMNSIKHNRLIKSSKDFLNPILTTTNKLSKLEVSYIKKIKKIFNIHKTKYIIITSPLLSKEKLSDKDLIELEKVFGSRNILNLAGQNKITNQIQNFKDPKHFNSIISKMILDSIKKTEIFSTH